MLVTMSMSMESDGDDDDDDDDDDNVYVVRISSIRGLGSLVFTCHSYSVSDSVST